MGIYSDLYPQELFNTEGKNVVDNLNNREWAVCPLPFWKSCLPFSISSSTSGTFALLLTDINITVKHNKSSAAVVFKPLPGVVSIYLRQIVLGKSNYFIHTSYNVSQFFIY